MTKKQLDIKAIEEKWRAYWEKEKIYKFNPKSKKKIYSIDTPPPYASSGHLHVGHALHYTQFEIMARIMRLLGREVYFPPGFDNNGLPTEKYVEEKMGIDKSKTNRAEFRKLCLKESEKVIKEYSDNVFKRLGHSYDWSLLYTTISLEAQRVSQMSFLKLVKKGDCYRKEEPVIWCGHHQTALAQAEVEDLHRTTKLNYVYFDVFDFKNEKVTIATTRPEYLPACVGVFVHPKDKRFKYLVGKELIVPLFNHKVKVMTDEKVDKDFGTGVVMVCTFGDNTDIEWWKKHKLELKSILNVDGSLNELAGKYEGLSLEEGRRKMLEDLEKEGRLESQEPLEQTVGSCWRCGTPVEYIVTKQWFVKTLKYKEELIKRAREIKWYPKFMRARFENWTENLGWDWIISRQRYYGVPIPVWYCEECDEVIFADEKELPVDPIEVGKKCKKCKKKARPEKDVLDTWMTSSNSPEVAGKWLENPELYKKIKPFSLRPQSHDIIRTWAFYTILKSHLLFNRIPWKDVMIGTYVLDPDGKGMHKSKGNALWADELIEKYGVDAFRYWVGSAGIGIDLPFKEQELVAGQRFIIKLWNASRFVFMHLKDFNGKKPKKLVEIDEWMMQKLSGTLEKVNGAYESYNISGAKREIEKFFWNTFTDNYLEIIKNRVYNGMKEEKESAQYVLYESLLAILKMIAPITCFITEEIYQNYFALREKKKSIHVSEWPSLDLKGSKKVEKVGDKFIEVLKKVRQVKSENKKAMNSPVKLMLSKEDMRVLKDVLDDLKSVVNASEIKEGKFGVDFK
ncbi:MAG: valine--tRNA ligase [Nanoarchaeota archaeon]|nr:valine--tRNA ligase [Nanoarchaeota archaeon]